MKLSKIITLVTLAQVLCSITFCRRTTKPSPFDKCKSHCSGKESHLYIGKEDYASKKFQLCICGEIEEGTEGYLLDHRDGQDFVQNINLSEDDIEMFNEQYQPYKGSKRRRF